MSVTRHGSRQQKRHSARVWTATTPHSQSPRRRRHHTVRVPHDEDTTHQELQATKTALRPELQTTWTPHRHSLRLTLRRSNSKDTMYEGPQTTKAPHSKGHRQGRHRTARAADSEDTTRKGPQTTKTPHSNHQTTKTPPTTTQRELKSAETV